MYKTLKTIYKKSKIITSIILIIFTLKKFTIWDTKDQQK